MKFFIFFLFLIFSVILVIAPSFSPTSLTYNLEKNEEECQEVSVGSESEKLTISDKWAENKDMEWKVSEFNNEASYHEITISYPKEIESSEGKVDVCISGNKEGEFHGVLLIKEEQVGNSVTQLGVWLKVIIGEEFIAQSNNQNTGESGGGSPNKNSQINVNTIVEEDESVKEEIIEELNDVEEKVQEITTKAVKETEKKEDEKEKKESYYKILGLIILLAIIGSLLVIGVYVRNKRRKGKWV